MLDAGTAAAAAVTKKVGRAARKAGAATEAAGADLARTREPLTAAKAKRLIGVGKAVAPLLAPYALAAAGVARGRWDEHRAARLGVEPGQLAAFAGPGGALHARLSRVAEALDQLDAGPHANGAGTHGAGTHGARTHGAGAGGGPQADESARRFAADTRPRLADLAVAVRAAERMPTPRRRAAYRAIGGELDRIETDLLTRLGVIS